MSKKSCQTWASGRFLKGLTPNVAEEYYKLIQLYNAPFVHIQNTDMFQRDVHNIVVRLVSMFEGHAVSGAHFAFVRLRSNTGKYLVVTVAQEDDILTMFPHEYESVLGHAIRVSLSSQPLAFDCTVEDTDLLRVAWN